MSFRSARVQGLLVLLMVLGLGTVLKPVHAEDFCGTTASPAAVAARDAKMTAMPASIRAIITEPWTCQTVIGSITTNANNCLTRTQLACATEGQFCCAPISNCQQLAHVRGQGGVYDDETAISAAHPPAGSVHATDFSCQSGGFRSGDCVHGGCPGTQYCCVSPTTSPTAGTGTACATTAIASRLTGHPNEAQVAAIETAMSAPRATWLCRSICSPLTVDQVTTGAQAACVKGGCPGQANSVLCCTPSTGLSGDQQCPSTAGGSESSGGAAGLVSIHLPDCVTSHDASIAGKCTLRDIENTGIAFANFILGLSGAVFLGIFIWGASLYVFFAYDSGKAKKGKEMIRNAAVGLALIIVAGTIVRFLVSAIGASTGT